MKKQKLFTALTDEQSEKVVGGVGQGEAIAGAGTQGWFGNGSGPPDPSDNGLFGSGQFSGPVPKSPGKSGITVWNPNKI